MGGVMGSLVLADAAASEPLGAAQFLPLMLVLWGTVAALRKREEAGFNRRIANGASLGLVTLFAARLFAVFVPLGPPPVLSMVVAFASVGAVAIAGFLLVTGIGELRRTPELFPAKHRGMIVAMATLLGLFLTGLVSGLASRGGPPRGAVASKGGVRDDVDLNYRFEAPGAPWSEFGAKKFNKDATLFFMRSAPETYFMLIAERTGALIAAEGVLELWEAHLHALDAKATIEHLPPLELHGLRGLRARARVHMGTRELAYETWIITQAGFAYQLFVWGDAGLATSLQSEATGLFERFRMLDAKLEAAPLQAPTKPFHSDAFGYDVDLGGAPFFEAKALATNLPSAEYGATCGDGGMAILPFPLLGRKAPPAVITEALFKRLGLGPPYATAPMTKGLWRGTSLSTEVRRGDSVTAYRAWALIGDDAALLVAAWQPASQKPSPTDCFSALEKVRLDGPVRHELLDPPPRPTGLGRFLNEVGLVQYRVGAFEEARQMFVLAEPLDADPVNVTNAADALERLGRRPQAITHVREALLRYPAAAALLVRLAELQVAEGAPAAAADAYAQAFAADYTADDAFEAYLRLLDQLDRTAEAVAAGERYHRRTDSLRVLVVASGLLAKTDPKAAAALLRKRHEGGSFDPSLARALIEADLVAEEMTAAQQVAEQLVGRTRGQAADWVLKGRSELALKWYTQAKLSFETALKADPAEADANRYLAHVSGILGQGGNSSLKSPIPPAPLPASFATLRPLPPVAPASDAGRAGAAAQEGPAPKEAPSSYSLRATVVDFQPGKDLRTTEYREIDVDDAAGVDAFSTFEFTIDPLYESFYVNELVVRDGAGNVVGKGDLADYYVSDQASEYGTQRQTVYLPVRGVRAGTHVSLAVTRRTFRAPDSLPFHTYRLWSRSPAKRAVLVYRGPRDALRASARPDVSAATVDGALTWSAGATRGYGGEPFAPHVDEFLPAVWLGPAGTTWKSEVGDYLASVREPLEPAPEAAALAHRLTARTPPAGRLAALVRFAQKEITYRAVEFGRGAVIPRRVPEVLERRFGDCKDKALLLHQMLGALGIESHLALVRSYGPLAPDLPSIDQFDHMIVEVPSAPGGFIDATDDFPDVTVPPRGLSGQEALVLDAAGGHFATIPPPPVGSWSSKNTLELRVTDGRDASIRESITLTGYEAAALRDMLGSVEPGRRRAVLEENLGSAGAEPRLESLDVKGLDDASHPVGLDLRYVVPDVFHEVDGALVGRFPNLWARLRFRPPARDETRQGPFHLTLPLTVIGTARVVPPPGYQVAPFKPDEASPQARAFVDWTVAPEPAPASAFRFSFERRPGAHSVVEYPAFVAAEEAALAALGQDVVLRKMNVAAAQ